MTVHARVTGSPMSLAPGSENFRAGGHRVLPPRGGERPPNDWRFFECALKFYPGRMLELTELDVDGLDLILIARSRPTCGTRTWPTSLTASATEPLAAD
jgi:hypothetical protein